MNKMIADRYMIVTSLGEGGMADVFLAIDTILNREVAIKILRGELSHDPVTLLRFQREANAASKLNHPNVVDVYDVGESEGKHYIVMEYVRGRTLKQLISQRGALDKEEAIDIMKQLVSAVEHAHENNIIHRDIKPQNVLVKDDGTIKITDFGIALAHDAVQLTQSDAVLGSAHYLAPETTRGEAATNQIDIYALGIVFYELLTGSVPFKGDNPVQIAMKHLQEEIPDVCAFNPTLPQSIENIVMKATVKNRNFRYQRAKDMLADLEVCLLPSYANVEPLIFVDDSQPTKVMESLKTSNRARAKSNQSVETGKTETVNKRSKMPTIIGILLIMITLFGGTTFVYFTGIIDGFSYNPTVVVPDVLNASKEGAIDKLTQAGFEEGRISFKEELSDDVNVGNVSRTEPAIGSSGKKHGEVIVYISTGSYFTIEDYTGKSYSDVVAQFAKAAPGAKITPLYEPTIGTKAGIIKAQSGVNIGDKIDPKAATKITFTVSSEPQIVISDILGKPIEEAHELLVKQGAVVVHMQKSTEGMSDEEIATLKKGVVIEVDPVENTQYIQKEGSKITLYYY